MEGERPWGMDGWKVLSARQVDIRRFPSVAKESREQTWHGAAAPVVAGGSGSNTVQALSSLCASVSRSSLSQSLPALPALFLLWLRWCSPLSFGHCPGPPRACRTPAPSQHAAQQRCATERADEKSGHGQWTFLSSVGGPRPRTAIIIMESKSLEFLAAFASSFSLIKEPIIAVPSRAWLACLPTNIFSEQVGFGRYETGGIWRMWAGGLTPATKRARSSPKASSPMHAADPTIHPSHHPPPLASLLSDGLCVFPDSKNHRGTFILVVPARQPSWKSRAGSPCTVFAARD